MDRLLRPRSCPSDRLHHRVHAAGSLRRVLPHCGTAQRSEGRRRSAATQSTRALVAAGALAYHDAYVGTHNIVLETVLPAPR